MCDYSLELVASRPAKVGDKLVSAGFPHTITRGFVSTDDPTVAVCVLPGTELAFEKEVRCETGILFAWRLGHKVARFRQVNKGRSNTHHDALEFPDRCEATEAPSAPEPGLLPCAPCTTTCSCEMPYGTTKG